MFKFTENQERWLQALESGGYPQQRNGNLHDNEGFCCLGVGCVALGLPSRPLSDIVDEEPWKGVVAYGTARRTAFPPEELVDALHLRIGFPGTNRLMTMNDSEGYSFAEIAAEVRANPTRYFTKGAE